MSHIIVKLISKVKYILAKDLFNKMNYKKPFISNTVYGRRQIQNYSPTSMFNLGHPVYSGLNDYIGRLINQEFEKVYYI